MINIYLENDGPVMKRLEEAPEDVIQAFLSASQSESDLMADMIRANASGGVLERRTGTLEESVQPEAPKVSGLQASVGVEGAGGDAWYGVVQETGIQSPYPEHAGSGSPLAFEVGGQEIFAKLVEHPAMPEHPWFTPVLDQMIPDIVEKVQEKVQEVLNK